MYGILFNVVLSAISTVVAGYMQMNGVGTPDLIAAIAGVAGANGAAAAAGVAKVRRKNAEAQNVEMKQAPEKEPVTSALDLRHNSYDDRA